MILYLDYKVIQVLVGAGLLAFDRPDSKIKINAIDTNICSYYNDVTRMETALGGIIMEEDYKELIIDMVKKIDNLEWLQFIHRLIKNLVG